MPAALKKKHFSLTCSRTLQNGIMYSSGSTFGTSTGPAQLRLNIVAYKN